ncbi:cilia- and flagella-associated protein 20-like [Copidosoma floridanum]|uniref:cilia- and flagella-associated protein 20-like n=1 Tax=Copidosoma floridanum TaxID=29053 RepID=UPI0006C9BF70|nr:cilia- and flagella-associated protein 20-like [Copidosoma floridanum]
MYRRVRQVGFIPVLQSFGPSPLEQWEMKVERNGFVRRVTDEQVRSLAIELSSTNVSTCYLRCPRKRRASLGINMKYIELVIKNMNKYFTVEITVLDDRNVHRRIRLSNFESRHRIQHFSASLPLCLKQGWNEMSIDLDDLTGKLFRSKYVEATRIQIHANCRIRVIYFHDKIYESQYVPQNLKMFLPVGHGSRKSKAEDEEVPPPGKKTGSIAFADLFEGEYEEEEEEDEGPEGMGYLDPMLARIEEEPPDVPSQAPSIGHGSMIIALGEGDDEPIGGYYDDDEPRLEKTALDGEESAGGDREDADGGGQAEDNGDRGGEAEDGADKGDEVAGRSESLLKYINA